MTAMFQHMFPSINVKTIKLAHCRRVVVMNLDQETKEVSFRMYSLSLLQSVA
jgi:ribosome biogenesis protein SSF1/2